MPRIRKKTSKRTKTNDRSKLRHKIREGKKKAKKEAKKNPQWKSRVKKDPGIPSSLPFKDQIIAEVEQSRMDETVERERKRELQKASLKVDPTTLSGVSTFEGSRALLKAPKPSVDDNSDEEMEDVEAPVLIDRSFPNLMTALDQADLVVQVLDARDPLVHRVLALEDILRKKNKPLLFLLNKIDLVPRESVIQWLKYLRQLYPALPFRSSSRFIPPPDIASNMESAGKSLTDAVGVSGLLDYLSLVSKGLKSDTSKAMKVAFIGHVNSGKSSVINSILGASVFPIYKVNVKSDLSPHSTTYHPQSVQDKLITKDGRPIYIVDTPGLRSIVPETVDENQRTAYSTIDMLLRTRGRLERVTDPMPAATHIVTRANTEDLMVHYNIPAFLPGDTNAFLTCRARSTGRLKKKGIPDLKDTASSLLRDWRIGKFPYVTAPLASGKLSQESPQTTKEPELAALYERSDPSILEALPSIKEMRTGRGLIRLKAGEPDNRVIELHSAYETDTAKKGPLTRNEGSEDDEDEVEDEDEGDGSHEEDASPDEMDDNEESESDDNEDDQSSEQSSSPPPSSKRKRSIKEQPLPPPTKKVAFAPSSQRKGVAPSKMVKTKPVLQSSAKSVTKNGAAPKPALKSRTATTSGPHAKKVKSSLPGPKATDDSGEMPYDFSAHFKS
ncbi:hypothetical protein FRC03_009474 [Tulasnella sp. 419]|nr:hypothetical protein FRC03_009474 [Tulasnella sp. 419]